MSEDSTPSSLLTPRQREILRGERDIGDRGKRAARARIRERIRAGVLDATLILESSEIPTKDIQTALEIRDLPEKTPPENVGDLSIEAGISDTIGLLYLANIIKEELAYTEKGGLTPGNLDETPIPSDSLINQLHEGWYFERRIEKGLTHALHQSGTLVDGVDVTIDITRGERFEEAAIEHDDSINTIVEKLGLGGINELKENTLLELRMVGAISPGQLMRGMAALRERDED